MSGTFKAAGNDIGSFFSHATNNGQIFSNPLVDAGLAASVLLPFLGPELIGGLGAGAGADAAAGGAGALGFAGDVGAGGASDVIGSAIPGLASDFGASGVVTLPEISNIAAAPALDLTGGGVAAGAPLDLLGAAGAGADVAGGGGAGLGDLVGGLALGSSLGSAIGSGAGALGNAIVGPANAAGASTAAGAGTLGVGGAPAAGGGPAGGAGASAASAAAPANANNIVSSDFAALGPGTTVGPTESSSGQPLAFTATDPTVIASGGGGGGGGFDLNTIGPGVSATGSALGDTSPITLGGGAAGSSGVLGNIGSWVQNNPLMTAALALGGGTLLKNLISPPKLPQQDNLEAIAQQAGSAAAANTAEGQQFLQPSLTGQLPPQLEAQVQQSLQDAINTTKARYASLGLGNSSMVSDQISYLQLQAEAMRGTLAQQLAQTGTQLLSQATSDLSIESNIYSSLMATQIAQDNALETSVSQFAGSLALASVLGSRTAAPTAKAA